MKEDEVERKNEGDDAMEKADNGDDQRGTDRRCLRIFDRI